jgi:DNA repair protein RadC
MTVTNSHKGTGHRQRLRDKFLASGMSGFHDYEVIELLLTLATPQKDCKETAKAALKKFKTLQKVLEASTAELCMIDGIGLKNLRGLKLIKDVADRYLK